MSLRRSLAAILVIGATMAVSLAAFFPLSRTHAATCPAITAYLQLGTIHTDVITLKKYLQSEGLLSGTQNTTYFGTATEAALKQWQLKKGIEPTGTAGPRTRSALANCGLVVTQGTSNNSCPFISLPLARGSNNSEVVSLQKYLSSLGLLSADSMTGYFGVITERALQTWQAQRGIVTQGTPHSTGFGATGPRTRAALLNCLSGSSLPSGSISVPIGSVPPGTSSGNQPITQLPTNYSCTLNGATIFSGASILAYKVPVPATGENCLSETRTCMSGTLSGTYMYSSCTPVTASPQSCVFNGASVANDSGVTAYQSSNVAAGQSCQSEIRWCSGGTLSGTFAYANCSVGSSGTNTCTFNGNTVAHGASVTAYQNSSVAAGSSCVSEQRTCSNGTLSGNYAHASCAVAAANSCVLDGVTVAHGASRDFYSARTSFSCSTIKQSRVCTNGILSGSTSFQYQSCTAEGAGGTASCMFNGNTVAHGASVTAYQSASVPAGSSCASISQVRTCTNGTLSGTYTYGSCAVAAANSCVLDGVTVAHGASQTFYSSRTVAFGSVCSSVAQSRACTNGTLGGSASYQYGSCTVSAAASCTFNGQPVAHGASVTAYQSASVPAGSSCVSQSRSCSNGTLSGTYTFASCSVAGPAPVAVDIPDPVYPTIPSGSENNAAYISNGDVYAATSIATYGAALTSVIRGGYEYVINDPPATPQYKRGGSWQGSFFFDSPLASSGANHTYYNDCNNPLETGAVADFTTANYGLTSPTRMYSPRAGVMQSSAQLAYYIDPYGPTDWWDPDNTAIYGTSPTCVVGKINNTQFSVHNNARLSPLFLGKTVTLSNIGTQAKPIDIPGVIAIDMVLATDKTYTYSGLHPAFASFPNPSIDNMATYDPRTKTIAGVHSGTSSSAFGRNPVIAYTSDNSKAVGIYTPQVALEGEPSGGGYGYLRTAFSTGLSTMMQYIRYDTMPAGYYKFKSYYIVGNLDQVKTAMDSLYSYFKILDPKVFNWSFYVSQNGLGSMSEDQARLHWVTTGIKQGLQAHSSFSVQTYLSSNPALQAQFGTNYFAAVQRYVDTH